MRRSNTSNRHFRAPRRSQAPTGQSEASEHGVDRPSRFSRIFRRTPKASRPQDVFSGTTEFSLTDSEQGLHHPDATAADQMNVRGPRVDPRFYRNLPKQSGCAPRLQMTNVPTNRSFQMPPSLVSNVPPRRSGNMTFAERVEIWKTRKYNRETTELAPSKIPEPRLYTEAEVGNLVNNILSQYAQSLADQSPVTHRSGPSVFDAPTQTQAYAVVVVPIDTGKASQAFGMPVPSMVTPSECTHSASQNYGPILASRNGSCMQPPLGQQTLQPCLTPGTVRWHGGTAYSRGPPQQQSHAPSLMASRLPAANSQFYPSLSQQSAAC
jgi:hypothetical protein